MTYRITGLSIISDEEQIENFDDDNDNIGLYRNVKGRE